MRYFCSMNKKAKSYDNTADWLAKNCDDVSEGIFHGIKALGLPYIPATINRITPMYYHEGEILVNYFLDYQMPTQKVVCSVVIKQAGDDEVTVDRCEILHAPKRK